MAETRERATRKHSFRTCVASGALLLVTTAAHAEGYTQGKRGEIGSSLREYFRGRKSPHAGKVQNVQVGARPYYLVDDMAPSDLKRALQACEEGPFYTSDFSIGHRGAPLQFPEHTAESYKAAARQGAGVIECDVTFTKDRELVCRHAQCDLHTTTNILAIPELAAKCRKPFTPYDAATGTSASAECCTSDLTLREFKQLCGKMDGANPHASTAAEYLDGTANFRTDLYASCGTLLTHAESISLLDSLGAKFTPELKEPQVPMPFDGDFTQQAYAQKLVDEYAAAGIAPHRVLAQSFSRDDVLYWVAQAPAFGKQAVYLDARVDTPEGYAEAVAGMQELAAQGVRIVAPPSFALLAAEGDRIVPSEYAHAAKAAGLEIITWSLERSGPLAGGGGYYFQSLVNESGQSLIDRDGDVYEVIDVLARKVGVRAIFSDWPATVTYYASCMKR
jgi:glycerophosphoryl diester phosphodiesterase